MDLAEIKTEAELSQYIECYWKYSCDKLDVLTIFPDGTFNVIVSTHDFYIGNSKKRYNKWSYLIPITLNPIRIRSKGSLYGIRFKAFSLNNIIGDKPKFLGKLNGILGSSGAINQVENHITHNEDLISVSSSMEDLSFELLNKNFKVNSSLRDKVNYLLDRRGNVRISELCDEFSISRQGLHKYFKTYLGISPKELATTWRLNHFFTLIDEPGSLTGSAIDAGYFDQSHSIKAFKSKWNNTPNSLKTVQGDLLEIARINMSNRFNNYYDPILNKQFNLF